MNNSNVNNYSYFADPVYQDIKYTLWTQIYFIGCGSLSAWLNLYLIFIFVQYPQLRSTPCNWIIIFQCLSEVLIGIGSCSRAITFLLASNLLIMNFGLSYCFWVGGFCGIGYRIGQTIALLMAVDRLLAIWKPHFYATRKGNKAILINALVTGIVLAGIIFMFIYGILKDTHNAPLSLSYCLYSTGTLYSLVIPTYSAIVTICFVVSYVAIIILFYDKFSRPQNQISQTSTIQRKLFITVLLVLLFYCIFYVLPSTQQMLQRYFGINWFILNAFGYLTQYGGQFNGCLNAMIYLIQHHEFNECSTGFVYRLLGINTSVATMVIVIPIHRSSIAIFRNNI